MSPGSCRRVRAAGFARGREPRFGRRERSQPARQPKPPRRRIVWGQQPVRGASHPFSRADETVWVEEPVALSRFRGRDAQASGVGRPARASEGQLGAEQLGARLPAARLLAERLLAERRLTARRLTARRLIAWRRPAELPGSRAPAPGRATRRPGQEPVAREPARSQGRSPPAPEASPARRAPRLAAPW